MSNILDEPVPNIKTKKKTKGNNIKQKILKIFYQFRRKCGRPTKMKEGWLGWMKNSILNLFNKLQKPDFKLVLEKSATKKCNK